jgi:hypothetical protein
VCPGTSKDPAPIFSSFSSSTFIENENNVNDMNSQNRSQSCYKCSMGKTHLIKRPLRLLISLLLPKVNNIRCLNSSGSAEQNNAKQKEVRNVFKMTVNQNNQLSPPPTPIHTYTQANIKRENYERRMVRQEICIRGSISHS